VLQSCMKQLQQAKARVASPRAGPLSDALQSAAQMGALSSLSGILSWLETAFDRELGTQDSLLLNVEAVVMGVTGMVRTHLVQALVGGQLKSSARAQYASVW
jgi:hypothetical protein